MFYLNLPASAKVGDTVQVKINGDPASVTWRDKDTLVIEPDDYRPIFYTSLDGNLRSFFCGSAGESKGRVEHHALGGVVISERGDA